MIWQYRLAGCCSADINLFCAAEILLQPAGNCKVQFSVVIEIAADSSQRSPIYHAEFGSVVDVNESEPGSSAMLPTTELPFVVSRNVTVPTGSGFPNADTVPVSV